MKTLFIRSECFVTYKTLNIKVFVNDGSEEFITCIDTNVIVIADIYSG